jgi:hypothetical protein
MNDVPPTLEEWKNLYDTVVMYKELACWRWMDDSMVFGVQNPEDGETGYCCVIGQLGEVMGLLVYLGNEGISIYNRMQSGELSAASEDIHTAQKCLSLTFDDRSMLDKSDLGVIKSLGLKFRGRQAWPSFRSHEPAFTPWYLTGGQARFLNLALAHTMDMAERLYDDPSLLKEGLRGSYLVKVPENIEGTLLWQDHWLTPEPFRAEEPAVAIDEMRLKRISKASKRSDHAWEVDFFCTPFTVLEGPRPFYPYMALYVVSRLGYVLNFCLAPPTDSADQFQENFLGFLENTGQLPKTIVVRSDSVFRFFKPFADQLGFGLKKMKRLKALDEAKTSFIEAMTGTGMP